MNKITKEIINSIPVIAFCGLITSIFLGFTIEFLEWSFKFFDWDFNFGSLYLSLPTIIKYLSSCLSISSIVVSFFKTTFAISHSKSSISIIF